VSIPPEADGATVIHPGAASAARRWPPERWAAVARAEADAGRTVVVTAGPGEAPLAAAVVQAAAGLRRSSATPVVAQERRSRGAIAPAGPTDLLQMAAVVAAAARVVCGDTGVAHLATALGTPSVVLFGPTSPARWGPPPDRSIHRVLWAGGEGDPHADQPDPGLLGIGVDDVLGALADLPAAEPLGAR
jgi:ADP-heptose:LPS heptosyltransferase